MSENTSLESVFRLVHSLKRQMAEHIENLEYDIAPMHMRVMKIITKTSPCTSIDIAHYLDRDKAQVTRLINALIAQSLLVKAPNPNDKRSHYLELSESGQKVMASLAEIDQRVFAMMANGLTEAELESFHSTAAKMAKNLEID
ncbi:MarR family winged helix-turn-helix transcriptional regulator [Vibrio sp. 10N]|uniref:MarR family winged helix-turn-helix transcriptional regulator n=1 Tax=Vibrio sp. 10N TaxID=3058938 RepID=UPI00281369CF|nr:MarR family transcriptional regulator [Vibrio sp. 10N]